MTFLLIQLLTRCELQTIYPTACYGEGLILQTLLPSSALSLLCLWQDIHASSLFTAAKFTLHLLHWQTSEQSGLTWIKQRKDPMEYETPAKAQLVQLP